MEYLVERCVGTKGKEENKVSMVVFPYNEEEILEQFGVESTKELYFVDRPESKASVSWFNYVMSEAEARVHKIEEQINASVKFLELRMKENPNYKGTTDTIPLSAEDNNIWNYIMKEQYKPANELVKVWCHSRELNVFYGKGDVPKAGRGKKK